MAKSKEVIVDSKVDYEAPDFSIDEEALNEQPMMEAKLDEQVPTIRRTTNKVVKVIDDTPTINCLRNEKVIVQFIPRKSGIWGNNPKHVLAGGMAEGSIRRFTVPRYSSGIFVPVLTKEEKDFLEEVMGLEKDALSIYLRTNNFWDNSTEGGINTVTLTKENTILDLSNPEDYIRYKILLANKTQIAPSLQALEDSPKATYQFVLIREGDETKNAKKNMTYSMQCYMEYGKIEDNIDKLRLIIESIDGRPTSPNSKLDDLQVKIHELIQLNSKLFLKVVTDPLLDTKVLIKKCVEKGLIARRGNGYYMRDNNMPLCNDNEDPTLNIAASYLNLAKNQDLKFSLEAKLKQ